MGPGLHERSMPVLLCITDLGHHSVHVRRTARKVIQDNATIQKETVTSTLLANQALNLWGIGSALIGLQVQRQLSLPCKNWQESGIRVINPHASLCANLLCSPRLRPTYLCSYV